MPPMEDAALAHCRELWPRRLRGASSCGHPVIWDRAGCLNKPGVLSRFGSIAAGFEALSRYDLDFCRAIHEHKRRSGARMGCLLYRHILIMDAREVHYRSILCQDFAAGVRQIIGQGAYLYPDTLATLYLVNASLVARTCWAIISKWVHPVTVAKVKVLGPDFLPRVLAETGVRIEDVPAEYGGRGPSMDEMPPCPEDG
mmetsp:Transcript_94651/g.287556  ORF Transcript_94651/g.287556 Transcript_94651/m.287556 type:complete len:199 (+) Transcript_94651:2-598(+)